MDEKELFKIPEFPVAFTEKDKDRLARLKQEADKLKQLYQSQFAPPVWEDTSIIEKGLREAATTVRKLPFGDVFPPMTPEEAETKRIELEGEIKELERRAFVFQQIPLIQKDLLYLASMGKMVSDPTTLKSLFKTIDTKFNEEELAYIMQYAIALSKASKEDIANGDVFKSTDPTSLVDFNDLFLRNEIDRRFIFSTVAFSKDLREIQEALRYAYPPDPAIEKTPEELLKAKENELKAKLSDYGLTFDANDPEGSVAKLAAARLYLDGIPVSMTDKKTGETIDAVMYPAFSNFPVSIWKDDRFIGFWDDKKMEFIPFNPVTMQPLSSEGQAEEWESHMKVFAHNALDALYMARNQFLTTIPMRGLDYLQESLITPKAQVLPFLGVDLPIKIENKWNMAIYDEIEDMKKNLEASYKGYALELDEWRKANQLEVKPEYLTPMTEVLANEGFIALFTKEGGHYFIHNFMSILPFITVTLGASAAVLALTRSPVAAGVVGGALGSVQADDVTQQLVLEGYSLEEASAMTVPLAAFIGLTESASNLVGLKAFMPALFQSFKKEIVSGAAKLTMKKIAAKGIVEATKVQIMETTTEVIQEAAANAVLSHKGVIESWSQGLDEVALRTALGMLPISAFGGGSHSATLWANTPRGSQAKIEARVEELKAAGMTEGDARTKATLEYLETAEGKKVREKTEKELKPIIRAELDSPQLLLDIRLNDSTMMILKEEQERLSSTIRSIKTAISKRMKKAEETTSPELKEKLDKSIEDYKSKLAPLEEENRKLKSSINELAAKQRILDSRADAEGIMTRNLWGKLPGDARRIYTNDVGLDSSVASKEWDELTDYERLALERDVKAAKAAKEVEERIQAIEATKTDWDGVSEDAKKQWIERAGIAKTSLKKSWDDLTSVQKALLAASNIGQEPMIPSLDSEDFIDAAIRETFNSYNKIDWNKVDTSGLGEYAAAVKDIVNNLPIHVKLNLKKITFNPSLPISIKARYIPETKSIEIRDSMDISSTPHEIGHSIVDELIELGNYEVIEDFFDTVAFIYDSLPSEVETWLSSQPEQLSTVDLRLELEAPIDWAFIESVKTSRLRQFYSFYPLVNETFAANFDRYVNTTGDTVPPITLVIRETQTGDRHGIKFEDDAFLPLRMCMYNFFKQNFPKTLPIEEGIYESAGVPIDVPPPVDNSIVARQISWQAEQANYKLALLHNREIAGKMSSPIDLDAIPNGSLKWKDITSPVLLRRFVRGIYDTKHVFINLQRLTGLPFFDVFQRMRNAAGAAKKVSEEILGLLTKDVEILKLAQDETAMKRVEQLIASEYPQFNIQPPTDLTVKEMELANILRDVFRRYEPKVSILAFERAYELDPNVDAIMKELGLEEESRPEVIMAIGLTQQGNIRARDAMIVRAGWGLIEGYTPIMIIMPKLGGYRHGLAARGEARLMHRTGSEMPEMDRTLTQRLDTYVNQIESQWQMRENIEILKEMLDSIKDKVDDKKALYHDMASVVDEIQHMPPEGIFSGGTKVLMRFYRSLALSIFNSAPMLLRNLFQAVVLHPYRPYLAIGLKDVSVNTKMKSDLAYEVLVSQMGGINRSVFFHGYKPILSPIPGYMPLVRLLDKLSLFAHTDEIPRKQSYNAGVGRAYRAIERYRLHGNVDRLIAESGIDYLRPEQQQKFLKYIALGDRGTPVNFGVEGLTDLSGYEAAAIFNGIEVADLANFNYERWMRGEIEHGIMGRMTFNLMTFTRSYWTRLYHDAEMMVNEEAPARQRIKAFTDVAMVIVMGAIVSALLQKLTRKNMKSYWLMDIGWWGTGGLALGGVNDILETGRLFVEIINPNNPEDERSRQLAMFTTALRRSSEILIPLWVTALQSFEAMTGWDGIDRRALDLVRKTLDENYDPKEFENLQLSFIEKLTKSLFNAKPIELNAIDEAIKVLREKETQLGTIDPDTGYIYTTTQYGREIRKYIKDIPGDLIDESRGFSPIVVYYKDYLYNLEEFESLPTKGNARRDYRKANLDFEVQLLFWGNYQKSIFYIGSKEYKYVANGFKTKCAEFGINPRVSMQVYADWIDSQIREK